MALNDKTTEAEKSRYRLENLGKCSTKTGQKIATNIMQESRRIVEIGAKNGCKAFSETCKEPFLTISEVR